METTVTGCKDCPLFNDEWDECNHPSVYELREKIDFDVWENSSPNWCPLNSEPITISKTK